MTFPTPRERTLIYGSTGAIANEISIARIMAHHKHGDNSIEAQPPESPHWLSILVEEVGELAHELTYDAGGTLASIRREAIDVATVAVALIASIDRAEAE